MTAEAGAVEPAPPATLTSRVRYGYAAGSVATGTFATVPGLVLLPYLTDTLAVPAALAGALVLLPKAWDVLCNPLAGRISDHTSTRWGARRPYLLGAGVALAVAFAAMFAHPGLTGAAAVVWVVAWFAICATAFAFFQVPYIAMAAEITDQPAERTRLMTRRIAVLALAILLSGAGAPAVRDAIGGIAGYRVMGLAMALLLLAGALLCFAGTARTPTGRPLPSAASLREMVDAVREAADFRRLWLVFLLQAVGIGTMLAGVEYVSRVVLGRSGFSAVLFAGFVGPALLVMPAWQLLSGRLGKVGCYQLASVVFGAAAIGLLVGARTPTAALVLVAVAGVGYAGLQVFPLALLPDISAAAELRTGGRRAGIFAGVWTAGETFGLALGPGIYGLVLALGGYRAGVEPAAQPSSAVTAAVWGFSLIPTVAVLAPILLLRRLRPLDAPSLDAPSLDADQEKR